MGTDPRAEIVVVGGGAAGATATRTLLTEGEPGSVVLLSGEAATPYDRTDLSKAVLTGARDTPAALYADDLVHDRLTVRTDTTVTNLDREDHRLDLDDGTHLHYGRLLLATGAEPRDLPLPGRDLDGVHLVREWAATPALRDAVRSGGHLVVVGGGVIGLEVAAAARGHGTDVTVLEVADRLMGRVLPPEVADVLATEHAAQGVHLELGVRPAALVGDDRVRGVALTDGRTLPADAAVIAIGVRPRTRLAADAGLAVDDGIVVDRSLRTTDPDVLAAGDVVRIRDAGGFLRPRSEAWTPALSMGQHAARVLLGDEAPYDEVPWMWSDQYDLKLQAAGAGLDGLTAVVRGRFADPDGLAVFGVDDAGIVRGVAGVSRGARIGRTVRAGQLLIQHAVAVPADQLADPTVELRRQIRGV